MRSAVALSLSLAGLLVCAGTAQASFHENLVSEVHNGAGTADDPDYIELQAYAPGQKFVGGHFLRTYDNAGNLDKTFMFPTNVATGDNQSTILVAAGPSVVGGVTPDFTDAVNLDVTSEGFACFLTSIAPISGLDCVAYGTVSAGGIVGGNPSPFGTAAAAPGGIVAGQSLVRSIAPGCATLLESADDTDNSATDFALGTPTPRPNSVTPTEKACGGGGGGDTNAPETKITKQPKRKTSKTTAKFKFSSSEPGSTFECKLDKGDFEKCSSPQKYRHLEPGKHKFSVEATDYAGNTDATPAKAKFRVVA